MYSIVRRYEGVIDSENSGRKVADEFVPLLEKIPGFIAYYWIDAGDGVMISTSVFEDESGIEASNRIAAEWLRDSGAFSLFPRPPQITRGKVIAHRPM